MAVTTDGIIAKTSSDNPVKWTSKEDTKLFVKTSKEAGVIIMGQNTFDTFGSPLPNRLNIVLTKETRNDIPDSLEHKEGDPKKILDDLADRGFEMVLICGGTFVNSLFLKYNLIDEIQITIEPKLFGSGLRLFDGIDVDLDLDLVEINKINENSINLLYKVKK